MYTDIKRPILHIYSHSTWRRFKQHSSPRVTLEKILSSICQGATPDFENTLRWGQNIFEVSFSGLILKKTILQSLKLKKILFFTKNLEKTQGICYLTIFSKRWGSRYNKNSTFCKSWWHLLLTHDFFCQIIFCSYIFSHFDTFFLFLFDFGVSEGIADLF